VTRGQAQNQQCPCYDAESTDATDADSNSDYLFVDVDATNVLNVNSKVSAANGRDFASKQQHDESLTFTWKLARLQEAGYVENYELLYHCERRYGLIIHA
jgi:hypothetical protein